MISRKLVTHERTKSCLDDEFEEASLLLFDKFNSGEMLAVISELTELELEAAPKKVREYIKRNTRGQC